MHKLKKGSDLRVLGWPAFQNKALNPYNWLLYSAIQKLNVHVLEFSAWEILFGSYDIVHIHWPEGYLSRKGAIDAFLKTFMVFFLVGIARLRKAKILWTIHNLVPHNEYHPYMTKSFEFMFPYFIDGYISLSQSAHQSISRHYPSLNKKKALILPFGIGHYLNIYPNKITKIESRKLLNIPPNAFVFLYLGTITPYKNVPKLMECFHDVVDRENILLVVGKPDNPSTAFQLQTLGDIDNRIRLCLQFIPDDELQIFLNSADLLVFPFQNILNSSSVVLSLSFNRPVLTSHMGSLVDLQKMVGVNWIQTYQGDLSSSQLLKAKNEVKMLAHQNINLDIFSWEKIAVATVEFYKKLLQ